MGCQYRAENRTANGIELRKVIVFNNNENAEKGCLGGYCTRREGQMIWCLIETKVNSGGDGDELRLDRFVNIKTIFN